MSIMMKSTTIPFERRIQRTICKKKPVWWLSLVFVVLVLVVVLLLLPGQFVLVPHCCYAEQPHQQTQKLNGQQRHVRKGRNIRIGSIHMNRKLDNTNTVVGNAGLINGNWNNTYERIDNQRYTKRDEEVQQILQGQEQEQEQEQDHEQQQQQQQNQKQKQRRHLQDEIKEQRCSSFSFSSFCHRKLHEYNQVEDELDNRRSSTHLNGNSYHSDTRNDDNYRYSNTNRKLEIIDGSYLIKFRPCDTQIELEILVHTVLDQCSKVQRNNINIHNDNENHKNTTGSSVIIPLLKNNENNTSTTTTTTTSTKNDYNTNENSGITILYMYHLSLNAVAITNVTNDQLQIILDDENVLYAERDAIVHGFAVQEDLGLERWGLDRIDQVQCLLCNDDDDDDSTTTTTKKSKTVSLSSSSSSGSGDNKNSNSDNTSSSTSTEKTSKTVSVSSAASSSSSSEGGTFHGSSNQYRYDYTGKNVRAYVVDSGIQSMHKEFTYKDESTGEVKSRVTCGRNFREDLNESCEDGWGHGTHVSSILGGKTLGVAKDVDLIAVKVFGSDGSSRFANIIAGIEYVIQQKQINPNQAMVMNLSLGTSHVAPILNDAVTSAVVQYNIPVVVASGNGGVDACTYSPASAQNVITVAASTIDDTRFVNSNWGECVDLYAPGASILGAWIDDSNKNDNVKVLSGTSMAAPFVSGAIALYLQQDPEATVATIRIRLLADALAGVLHDADVGESAVVNEEGYDDTIDRISPNLLVNVQGLLMSQSPTRASTRAPANIALTKSPIKKITHAPTTLIPSMVPTLHPTTIKPSLSPSRMPITRRPTYTPTDTPTDTPTNTPTNTPTKNPTRAKATVPTQAPSQMNLEEVIALMETLSEWGKSTSQSKKILP